MADAAVALLPDVVGRPAFVSTLAAVIAGVESAASEAKPAVSDSAFELTASGSLSALASDSAEGEGTSVAASLCASDSALGSDSAPELGAASLSGSAQEEGDGGDEAEGSDESMAVRGDGGAEEIGLRA